MSKILAVFGATGQQGSSIVNHVLNDSTLSQQYKIRAIIRNVDSEKALRLKNKVEVVQGDVSDRTSLVRALAGVHTIFAMTTPSVGPDAVEDEFSRGKNIVDVAIEKGAQYIIFSTLPFVAEISGGKYTKVTPFDAKAKIEQYIRTLPIKSAFLSLGSFMENFEAQKFLAPRKSSDGTWVLTRNSSPQGKMPLLDAVGDIGKFAGVILTSPAKYEGQTLCAATALYDWEEIASILSKATGETVVYQEVSDEEFVKGVPFMVDVFSKYFRYIDEFGYFGPESEKLVAWAAGTVPSKLSTFEQYLERYPLKLE